MRAPSGSAQIWAWASSHRGERVGALGARNVISSTQILLQTARLKIARSLPHAALLARELVNLRFKVGQNRSEDVLDWREGPDGDPVLAMAIAAWGAECRPGLASLFGYGVSESAGWRF